MSRQPRSSLRFQPARGVQAHGLQVGQKETLHIERLAHDGRGIAFHAGRTWFVSGAMLQEQVQAQILSVRNKLVEARAIDIQQPSPERREPFCAAAGRCGGCTLQHMPIAMQHAIKRDCIADQLQQAGVAVEHWLPTLHADEQAYRRRTRIAVKADKRGQLQVGFRALASQQIVAVQQCPVLVEPLQRLLHDLVPMLKRLKQGRAIGHVELLDAQQPALLVRLTAPLDAVDEQLLRDFCRQQNAQLWWQEREQPYPDQPGTELYYQLPAFALQIDCQPGDFVQVNAQVNQQMLEQAIDWLDLPAGALVLDLFCGLGNFSLPLARHAAQVVAVEGVSSMVERARQSAQRQAIDNLHFYHFDLSQSLLKEAWAQQQFSAIVLDPPREGAAALVQQLGRLAAEKILYVSCNPATLARDAAALQTQGYRLERVAALDMFSQTGHVETMALFVRPTVKS